MNNADVINTHDFFVKIVLNTSIHDWKGTHITELSFFLPRWFFFKCWSSVRYNNNQFFTCIIVIKKRENMLTLIVKNIFLIHFRGQKITSFFLLTWSLCSFYVLFFFKMLVFVYFLYSGNIWILLLTTLWCIFLKDCPTKKSRYNFVLD